MIPYTETYHKARLAGALPILLLYLGTDRGLRCFGKHTPTPEQVGDDALEWSARVLTFGDFRESLSSDSEIYLQGLFEEEVSSYGAELDSADGYFQEIAGKEVFLNGDCILMQGFDYPGFAHADFIPKFYGKIDTFEFDNLRFKFTAIQAVAPQVPEDPSVTSESIYALSNAGVGFTGASESYPYADLEESFYAEESWIYTIEVTLETITESVFFRLGNAAHNNNRLEIGVDSDDKLYLTYTDDVDTASPTYQTLTSSVTLAAGGDYRVSVDFDADAGTVTFKDGKGQSDVIVLPTGSGDLLYSDQFGTTGTGTGDFNGPLNLATDASGSIYVVDSVNNRIQKFTSEYVYSLTFSDSSITSPVGVAIDSFGDVWVATTSTLFKFSSTGTLLSSFAATGLSSINSIAIDSSNYILATSAIGTNALIRYDSLGSANLTIPRFTSPSNITSATSVTVDTLDAFFVSDRTNSTVLNFSSSGSYIASFGSVGNGDGQFENIVCVYYDAASGHLFTSDDDLDRIQEFTTNGTFIQKFGENGSGDGQFDEIGGLGSNIDGDIFVTDYGNDRVQVLQTSGDVILPDFSDNGSSDDLIVMEDVDGESPTMGLGGWQTVNADNTATEWEDIVDGVNVTLDDGVWVDSTITTETYTETLERLDSADPTEELIFPDTSRYDDPGENQQNVILPLPYGNVRENSDGGVWVCPLIDNVNHVYAVAGWPIQSVANGNTVDIYVDGVLQSSGYAFDESNDYESQGEVAIVTFTSDPGGTVTAKCNGKWVDGALPTNPVDIIDDFMSYAAELVGTAAWEQDPTTFAIARNVANTASYTCAGIITSNNSLGYWIKAMLKSFLGGFRFNSSGKLEIKLTPLEETEAVHEWLDEYEAITAIAKQNVKNICGRIIVNYANSYTEIDRRFKEGGESSYFRTADKSQDAINPQSWTLDFDWCRNSDNVGLIQDILLALYADPEYNVTYQGQDFKYVPLSLTDQIQATFSFLRDNDNVVANDIIYRIREKTINLDNFTTSMVLQSVNFVAVSDPSVNNVTLGGENVTLGGEQVTLGGA